MFHWDPERWKDLCAPIQINKYVLGPRLMQRLERTSSSGSWHSVGINSLCPSPVSKSNLGFLEVDRLLEASYFQ